jgi:hypothetical protein
MHRVGVKSSTAAPLISSDVAVRWGFLCCAFVTPASFVFQEEDFPIALSNLADHSCKD